MNRSTYRASETTIAALADFWQQAKRAGSALNRASVKGLVLKKSTPSRLTTANVVRVDFAVLAQLTDGSDREFGRLSIDMSADSTIDELFAAMQKEFNDFLAQHYQIEAAVYLATTSYGL